MKKYLVTKTYTQEVEAENVERAEEVAEEQHMDSPEYDTDIVEITKQPTEVNITIWPCSDEVGYYIEVELDGVSQEAKCDSEDMREVVKFARSDGLPNGPMYATILARFIEARFPSEGTT